MACELAILIGKKVVALRGMTFRDKRRKKVPLTYIMFDDGATYLELTVQDPHSYHDCAWWARQIEVRYAPAMWEQIMTNKEYADSTEDFYAN